MDKDYFYAVFFIIVVDVLTVAANFVVRECGVSAPDVVLSKGVFQILISAFIIVCSTSLHSRSVPCRNNITTDDFEYEEIDQVGKEEPNIREALLPSNRADKMWALLFGSLAGIKDTTAFAALHFPPVSDFTLVSTTNVIFTYVFGYFMIGTKFTSLKSLPCLMLLGGICLALKPSFIFGHDNIGPMDRATWTTRDDIVSSNSHTENQYWVGILLSFLLSLTAAMNKIIPKKCRNVSCITLLLWSTYLFI